MSENTEKAFSFPITVLAGSSLSNFIRLRKDYGIDRKYLGRFMASISLSAILEPFRLWEEIRWKNKIRDVQMQDPPIFIIGFWRSGTTFLHDLLCQSGEASYVTTFQTVFPHLTLSHARWIKPLANLLMPAHRPVDNVKMNLDYPQEEEIALANIQPLSFYNFFYFPRYYKKFYHRDLFFDHASEKQLKKWKKEYRKLVSKALINRPGRRFISKNPSNMARIGVLLEMYPDAKFIFIYRDPYSVVESYYRFFTEVIEAIQLQGQDDDVSHNTVAHLYADMIGRYYDTRHLIPEGNLLEMRYEDLVSDPTEQVRKIYEQFGMEGFEEHLSRLEIFLRTPKNAPGNHFEISRRTIERVNEYFIDQVKRWNYEVKS